MKKYLISVCLLFLPGLSAVAADIQGYADLDNQFRKNQNSQWELPADAFLGGSFRQDSGFFAAETDMRFFRDLNQTSDDYDLYQAVLHVQPEAPLQLDFGRQFVSQGFAAAVMDGSKLTVGSSWPLELTVYSGELRSVETGDFNLLDDSLLTGATLRLTQLPQTSVTLNSSWRRDKIGETNWRQNDQVFVGLAASSHLNIVTHPDLYGVFEYDASGQVIDNGSAGVDLSPGKRVALNAEFNYYNTDRQTHRNTIAALFSRGRTLTGRLASTWTVIPKYLNFVQTYAFQQVTVLPGQREQAHILDASLELSFDTLGLSLNPGYYFTRSFGGQLHGAHVSVLEQFTDRWSTQASVDFSKYTKVTNDNDNALSLALGTGYEVVDDLNLSAGFEYNRNNEFDRDVRGLLKLSYFFKHSS